MPGEETVITMGGRKGRKVSKVLSLHVENEARTHSLRRRRAPVCLSPLTPLRTPDDQLLLSSDSGYTGGSTPDSDPDWFLRPKKLSFDECCSRPSQEEVFGSRKGWAGKIKELVGLGRPNYVDYQSPKWFLRTEAILGAVIVVTILACLGFCVMISAKLFHSGTRQEVLNGKYRSIQFASERVAGQQNEKPNIDQIKVIHPEGATPATTDTPHIPRESQEKLEEADSSQDNIAEIEVIDLLKDKADDDKKQVKQEPEGAPVAEVKAETAPTQKFKVEKAKDSKRKRSKNQNPMTKGIKKSPRKSGLKSLDYPDDPSFRAVVGVGREL